MTKLLVTGGGDQLVTGGGVPLTTDASVVSLRAAAMAVAFGMAATASGVASASVEPMPVTVSLSARISTKGGVSPMPIVFAMSARATATVAASAHPATIAFDLSASPSGSASAVVAPMPIAFDLTAKPTASNIASLRAAPMPVTFDLSARATRAADLRAAPMFIGLSLSAIPSVNTGPKFRGFWIDAYDARQNLLNAIDANNRYLAKEAGDKASAAADAVVLTNTRVDDLEDGVEAESQRTTALITRVTTAEGTLGTQGSALSALQTTSSNHAGMLSTQAGQITSINASITGLNGQVTNVANATSVLQAEVNSLGAARAIWGVYLNVNGHISGVQSINDGVISEFNVAASVFRLLSPAGADGMEIQNGYIRVWKGSSQRIIGNVFGANNDLMDYFGPNVGVANASKSNAIMWMDQSGNAYWGGALSAGVLKNAAQTTVLTANPTIAVGPFSTNGKTKVVTIGYTANSPTYTNYFPGRPESAGPPPPPTISQAPTDVTLHRSYSGGASTQVATVPVSHGASVTSEVYIPADAFNPNLPGGGWEQDYNWSSSASLTYSDTLVGTGTFTYAAYAGSPTYTISRQTLSVTSVEQP